MSNFARLAFGFSWLFLCASLFAQEDPFATHIRPTDPLSPQEERETFKVPEGFEVQLFAADPQILKPLNMAFDADGRLWVTDTQEYPFPVKEDEAGRDSIKILEDTDNDGTADKITTFATGLNIPIGIYPYGDGVIAFSIPNIWHLRDTNGDGKADKKEKLFGPFAYDRDTHGLNNSFRRNFDGWLHACHGFNNQSRVAGADGHEIFMPSGNTYRMQLDGSRIELFTHGQVNPFGMALDPLGNIFTADCHSKPVYQLLRDGCYPSFGRPHDGLGFVPPMMDHTHGSTAIAGITVYIGENFPPEYRGNTFSGNVMTSRVNRDILEFHGSTILAREAEDFMVTSDPWFRPVDVRTGPDGALYVADFYNRIIGHYEVDLKHPGRDRTSGRIWRVVYKGDHPDSKPAKRATPLSHASLKVLLENLDHPTLTQRLTATHEIVDRIGKSAIPEVKQLFASSDSPFVKVHSLWILKRLSGLSEAELKKAATDSQQMVRTHAMKVLTETKDWSDQQRSLVSAGLKDSDAFVKRAAAEALSVHPSSENIPELISALQQVPEEDNHLKQMLRIALRNTLEEESVLAAIQIDQISEPTAHLLAEVMPAVKTGAAASFLVDYLYKYRPAAEKVPLILKSAASQVTPENSASLIKIARDLSAEDQQLQAELIEALRNGLSQQGAEQSKELTDWAGSLARGLLDRAITSSLDWTYLKLPGSDRSENLWGLWPRRSAESGKTSKFIDSFVYHEKYVGLLRSKTFSLPETFTFDLSGHLGDPKDPPHDKNLVRLRLARNNEVIKTELPPRNDVAKTVTWELSDWKGKPAYLEVQDGDTNGAYAWIAVGNFKDGMLMVPKTPPKQATDDLRQVAGLVRRFNLSDLAPSLKELLKQRQLDSTTVQQLGNAILANQPDLRLQAALAVVSDPSLSVDIRARIVAAISGDRSLKPEELLSQTVSTVPQRLQLIIAENLAGSPEGQQVLLELISAGKASARLLLNTTIKDRLAARKSEEINQQVEELTGQLKPVQEEIQKLIHERVTSQRGFDADLVQGEAMFVKHCSGCHQIKGKGSIVGPQLDGIGARGLERLMEDILDPNRNVDEAFRTTTVIMESGIVHSGLIRRTEGKNLIIADNKGKEFTIPVEEIEEQVRSTNSLMPGNVFELMNSQEFRHLVSYLLTQKVKTKKE